MVDHVDCRDQIQSGPLAACARQPVVSLDVEGAALHLRGGVGSKVILKMQTREQGSPGLGRGKRSEFKAFQFAMEKRR